MAEKSSAAAEAVKMQAGTFRALQGTRKASAQACGRAGRQARRPAGWQAGLQARAR